MLFHCKEGGQQLCEIVDMCREYGIADKVVFGLQDPKDVRILKAYAPDVPVLAFMRKREDTEMMVAVGADIIRLWDHWATPEAISRVRAAGKQLWIMAKRPIVGEIEPALEYYRTK